MNVNRPMSLNAYLHRYDWATKQQKLRSPWSSDSLNSTLNSLNEIFIQKIVLKSQTQIYNKLGEGFQVWGTNLKSDLINRLI